LLFDVSFTTASGSPQDICILASKSEKLGFHSFWMAHDLLWDNAWVICGAIARSTSRILIGPGIVNPYSSTLPEIAMAATTLDNISGGRSLLGIGPGAKLMLEAGGVSQTHAIGTLGSAIEYLKDALKPGSKTLRIEPTKQIPIYVGCQSPKLLESIGRWQVGSMPMLTPPSYAKYSMQAIRRGAEKEGKPVDEKDHIASLLMSLSTDEEKSRKSFAKFMMSILEHLSPHQLKEAGFDSGDVADLLKVYAERGWEAVPEKVYQLGVIDVESCIKSIETASQAGFGRVKCGSPLGPDKEEAMEILAKYVVPHFEL
jgi:5,10-methylenetetrahydromethanopterin reductase